MRYFDAGILEQIMRWIVHAAIFRAVWSAPGGIVAAGALVAVIVWWWLRRRRGERR